MVTISIFRKNTLDKTVGFGRGIIVEGTITAVWDDVKNIEAASFELKSLSRLIVNTGTPLIEARNFARVNAPGSMNNEAQVRSIIEQRGSWARFGTPKYISYDPDCFAGTPMQVMVTPGSGLTAGQAAAHGYHLRGHTSSGSFSAYGSVTADYGYYKAFGYGSYPLGFIAVGD